MQKNSTVLQFSALLIPNSGKPFAKYPETELSFPASIAYTPRRTFALNSGHHAQNCGPPGLF